jgi:AraC-like DNA-binding protein
VSLVDYREHRPNAALRAHVACYWSLEASEALAHRVLPDGCMDLLFDVSRGTASLVGAMTTAIVAQGPARARLFGVRFLPGEAFAFVSLPAWEARDTSLPLAEVWGRLAEQLADEVATAPDGPARIAALDRALLAHRPRAADARVRRAVRRIMSTPAGARVAWLARDVGLGERQLERSFLERVGLGPKAFGRVARLQGLLAHLAPQGPSGPFDRFPLADPADAARRPPWAFLASHLGYADQAHLVREVKRLAGLTPTALALTGTPSAWSL